MTFLGWMHAVGQERVSTGNGIKRYVAAALSRANLTNNRVIGPDQIISINLVGLERHRAGFIDEEQAYKRYPSA